MKGVLPNSQLRMHTLRTIALKSWEVYAISFDILFPSSDMYRVCYTLCDKNRACMWAHNICLLLQTFMNHNFLVMLIKYGNYIYFLILLNIQWIIFCKSWNTNILFQYWVITCYVMACIVCAHLPCFHRPGHKYCYVISTWHIHCMFLTFVFMTFLSIYKQ